MHHAQEVSKVMVNMRETLEILAFSEAEATAQAPWLQAYMHMAGC